MTQPSTSDKPIISVRNLSKTYKIGGPRDKYKRLTESLSDAVLHPGTWLSSRKSSYETFYALKDVSFDVYPGEVVGIIGRNGAGKSTLLKILSGITYPSAGVIELNGRVGSLLEVGTGFHPELTGRENIYFNGSILGMTRREIDNKFDDIVKFAGIDEFLDTPVKRYSSGMAVRLGFAVAAHLDPEILVVDEVLAVGDAEFQKKCLGKMKEVSEGGRTVLFVSHNMGAISSLCERVILFKDGKIKIDGYPDDVIIQYLKKTSCSSARYRREPNLNIPMCLIEANTVSNDQMTTDFFPRDCPINVHIKYLVNHEIKSAHVYSNILTPDGIVVIGTGDADLDSKRFETRKPGLYECVYQIPGGILNDGVYNVCVSFGIPYLQVFQHNDNIISFTVNDINPKKSKYIHHKRNGIIHLDIIWTYNNSNKQ